MQNHHRVGVRPYRLTDLVRWYHDLGMSADDVTLRMRKQANVHHVAATPLDSAP